MHDACAASRPSAPARSPRRCSARCARTRAPAPSSSPSPVSAPLSPRTGRRHTMADHRTFVIVGAGLAGAKAAETLRDGGLRRPRRPARRRAGAPVRAAAAVQGPAARHGRRDSVYVHDADWYAEHDVELRTGTRVDRPSTAAGTACPARRRRRLGYDKLLLATGAAPRAPAGARRRPRRRAPPAHPRRHRPDRRRPWPTAPAWSSSAPGWIGLEVAAAARKRGAAVTVVETAALPLQRVLGDRIAARLRRPAPRARRRLPLRRPASASCAATGRRASGRARRRHRCSTRTRC